MTRTGREDDSVLGVLAVEKGEGGGCGDMGTEAVLVHMEDTTKFFGVAVIP